MRERGKEGTRARTRYNVKAEGDSAGITRSSSYEVIGGADLREKKRAVGLYCVCVYVYMCVCVCGWVCGWVSPAALEYRCV